MSDFWNKFKHWAATAGSAAISAGVVAGGVTFLLNDVQDARSKRREAEYAQIQKIRDRQNEALDKFFSDDADEINKAAEAYISDIISKNSPKKAGDDLSAKLNKRVRQAETLKAVFPSEAVTRQVTNYQNAMQQFSSDIDGFKKAIQIQKWSEDYIKMQNIAIDLEKKLREIANKPMAEG